MPPSKDKDKFDPTRYIEITEMYEEKYPTGKRNYEMVAFGPVIEKRTIYIPADCENPNQLIADTHMVMHDRLARVVAEQVNKAIRGGRLVGMSLKEVN